MFGKMMNRYYYGKSGKGDYTKEDLPQTRWQLFWEMLRVRLSGLVRLNDIAKHTRNEIHPVAFDDKGQLVPAESK